MELVPQLSTKRTNIRGLQLQRVRKGVWEGEFMVQYTPYLSLSENNRWGRKYSSSQLWVDKIDRLCLRCGCTTRNVRFRWYRYNGLITVFGFIVKPNYRVVWAVKNHLYLSMYTSVLYFKLPSSHFYASIECDPSQS